MIMRVTSNYVETLVRTVYSSDLTKKPFLGPF